MGEGSNFATLFAMNSHARALQQAEAAGIDLSLLESNLRLGSEDRILRNESALRLVRALRKTRESNEAPHALIERLAERAMPFVLIGGIAGVLHGSAYVSETVAICVDAREDVRTRLRALFADWNPAERASQDPAPTFLNSEPTGQMILQTDRGILNVFTSVVGLGAYAEVAAHAREFSLWGRSCRVLALNALIQVWEAGGRDADRLLALELRALDALQARPTSA